MSTERVLVLDFNDDTKIATCFDRISKETVKIRMELYSEPHPGQFIHYLKNAPVENGIVIANPENAQIENPTIEDCVRIVDGQLKISAWIGFSDKPHHKTFDRNLAFGDWYGLIDNSHLREVAIALGNKAGGKRLFTSLIVVNDLNYRENGTRLFKVSEFKYPITGKTKQAEVLDNLRKLEAYEEALASVAPKPPTRIPTSVSTPSLMSTRLSADIETRPLPSPTPSLPPRQVRDVETRPFSPTPSPQSRQAREVEARVPVNPAPSQSTSQFQQFQQFQQPPPGQTRVPVNTAPTQSTSQLQQPPPGQLSTMSIAMTSTSNGDLVIWMHDRKAVAMLRRNCYGYEAIRLGAYFECIVQKSGNNVFEVTGVRRMLGYHLPFQIQQTSETEFEAEFVVDLCTPNFDFNFWMIYTGIAVLNAEGVGMVTTADTIITPTGERKKLYQVMRSYQGDPRASRMVGMCRLEEQRVPRRVVDGDYQGFETVLQFHWKLYRLKASSQHADRMDVEQRMENLGLNAQRHQEEDDVARQKREIRQGFHRY